MKHRDKKMSEIGDLITSMFPECSYVLAVRDREYIMVDCSSSVDEYYDMMEEIDEKIGVKMDIYNSTDFNGGELGL
jgi:hypothetical protein